MANAWFTVAVNQQDGSICSLVCPKDTYGMNWAENTAGWGRIWGVNGYGERVQHPVEHAEIAVSNLTHTTVYTTGALQIAIVREFSGAGQLTERYIMKNISDTTQIYGVGDIGISVPFPDRYQDAGTCMYNRCHAHIWCGGDAGYVMAVRMGGQAPHLGLVLEEGSLMAYGVVREQNSNDRGNFILYPRRFALKPLQSHTIAWTLFWFDEIGGFYERAARMDDLCAVGAQQYTCFPGEPVKVYIPADAMTLAVDSGPAQPVDAGIHTCLLQTEGEHTITLGKNGRYANIKLLSVPAFAGIVQTRCRFIVRHQQCMDSSDCLYGAYLAYDNQTGEQVYSQCADKNAGRERAAMSALLALCLQKYGDDGTLFSDSLRRYHQFARRELYDADTGEVFDDAGRNRMACRLYNYPWMAVSLLEMFLADGDRAYLDSMYRVLQAYYTNGGGRFYGIGLPMRESISVLRRQGMYRESDALLGQYLQHVQFMVDTSENYPAHEVSYEQSIVAPAAIYCLEAYLLTGKQCYLSEGRRQLQRLLLFCGQQPDYHLHQISIRHWDGYWFGKRRLYGDTFPHHWSVLTAVACQLYFLATGDADYRMRANAIFRNHLCLFHPDGSASCAYLYPFLINGQYGKFYDPWANDQDWALVYAMQYMDL